MMRRIGTVVGLLAGLAAGCAHAAGELIGDAGFETQLLGQAPAAPLAPWSADNTIVSAQNSGQSYAVLVDGVEVGAFSTSTGQAFVPSGGSLGALPPEPHGRAPVTDKASLVRDLPKPAAWSLVILGFGAIGLTLRGGRRAEAPSA